MNTLTRPAAALAGISLLLSGALAGCSNGSLNEVTFNTASPSASTNSSVDKDDGDSGSSDDNAVEPAAKKSEPECTVAALNESFSTGFDKYTFIEDCEGGFAHVGKEQSDHLFLARWTGDGWEQVSGDGTKTSGLAAPCFNESTLDRLGVGPRVKAQQWNCATEDKFGAEGSDGTDGSGNSGGGVKVENGIITQVVWEFGETFPASRPACDGRNILILKSVIDSSSDHKQAISDLGFAMAFLGGERQVEFTVPGHCSSLRGYAEGGNVYPVYLDFGSNLSGMCAAKAKLGGNGRVLDNSGQYIDPCL